MRMMMYTRRVTRSSAFHQSLKDKKEKRLTGNERRKEQRMKKVRKDGWKEVRKEVRKDGRR